MLVAIEVLEEALGVESVLPDELCEVVEHPLHVGPLRLRSFGSAIDDVGASVTNFGIQLLFKAFLGENLIDSVDKLSPLNMSAFFGSFESIAKLLKFLSRDGYLGHIETNSELRGGDEARSEPVEVPEELSDSDPLLTAGLSDASEHIFDICWGVADDLCLADSRLCFWEVVEAVVEVSANPEELFLIVNVLGEVNIVDLVDISLVHVTPQQHLQLSLGCSDAEQVQHTQELGLGDMAILSDIEVLEDWFEMDALVLDCSPVLLQQVLHPFHLLWVGGEVLSSGKQGVVLGHRGHSHGWIFVNACRGECFVDACNEVSVLEKALWVVSLILVCEGFKLVVRVGEVHAREDGFELSASHSALPELVEVSEELLNPDSFHHNSGSEPVFNVLRIAEDVDSLLLEPVVDDINLLSRLLEV